jgi:general secretion pathway protein B
MALASCVASGRCDAPGQRLLLVNGQVLSQGSLAAPDLTLERIGANTSEFSFRGTRFRIAH